MKEEIAKNVHYIHILEIGAKVCRKLLWKVVLCNIPVFSNIMSDDIDIVMILEYRYIMNYRKKDHWKVSF